MDGQWDLGRSVEGRALKARAFAPAGRPVPETPSSAPWPWLLFMAGVHGDEVEGIWLMDEMEARWEKSFPATHVGVVVFANANPDGAASSRRWNARGIDLNRNLPSKDWTPEIKNPRYPPGPSPASEPEAAALVKLIASLSPLAILSAHSFSRFQLNVNGPSREWAERVAPLCGYPVTEDIGYPTPGSLGSYAGIERRIPTLTLEVERGLPRENVLSLHIPLVEASLRFWDEKRGSTK